MTGFGLAEVRAEEEDIVSFAQVTRRRLRPRPGVHDSQSEHNVGAP